MKRLMLAVVIVAIGLGSATSSHALTSNLVYQVSVTGMTGVSQGIGVGGVPKIVTTTMSGNSLINLARGRAINAKVPANEVLAVAVNGWIGTWGFTVIVYDKTAQVSLATVADVTDTTRATSGAAHTVVTSLLDVNSTSSSVNNLDGGSLVLSGVTSVKFPSADPRAILFTLSGSLVGIMDVTMNGTLTTMQITKGHIATKNKAIGVLITP